MWKKYTVLRHVRRNHIFECYGWEWVHPLHLADLPKGRQGMSHDYAGKSDIDT